jgi:hypothetical protein
MLKNKLFLLLILSSFTAVFAQLGLNSPYSRYGLGNTFQNNTSYFTAMGGVSTAMASDYYINTQNPALLSNLYRTTFDLGFNYNNLRVKEGNLKNISNNFGIQNLHLAFPIKNRYVFALGLSPFSIINYQVNTSQKLDSTSTFTDTYKGTGGLSQVSFSNSFSFIKDTVKSRTLALGFDASLIAGNKQVSSQSILNIDGVNGATFSQIANKSIYRAFQLNIGASFRQELFYADRIQTLKSSKCDSSRLGSVVVLPSFNFKDEVSKSALKAYQTKYAIVFTNSDEIKISDKIKKGEQREQLMDFYKGFVKAGYGVLILEEALNVNYSELKNNYLDFVATLKTNQTTGGFEGAENYAKEYLHYGSGIFFNLGAAYQLPTQADIRGTEEITRLITKFEDPIETYTVNEFSNQNGTFPSTLRLGLSIDKPFVKGYNPCGDRRKSTWSLGLDFTQYGWAGYQELGKNPNWKNTYRFALGGSIKPNPSNEKLKYNTNFRRFLNQVEYQGGLYFQTLPYTYNSKNLSEYGFNLGFSLPTNHDGGHLTCYFGLATRGNELKENYIKAGLGLSINEGGWFKPYRLGR